MGPGIRNFAPPASSPLPARLLKNKGSAIFQAIPIRIAAFWKKAIQKLLVHETCNTTMRSLKRILQQW